MGDGKDGNRKEGDRMNGGYISEKWTGEEDERARCEMEEPKSMIPETRSSGSEGI